MVIALYMVIRMQEIVDMTQGVSDAMQMAHYKLTIIIIIM